MPSSATGLACDVSAITTQKMHPGCNGASYQALTFSRMNPLILPSSHCAHTTNTSAMGEFVIQLLVPLSVYVRVDEL